MRMTVAIIDAEKSWTVPAFLSKLVFELLVANKLWSLASGKPVFVGEASVEFKVQDACTGELLVAGVDRRVGGQKLFELLGGFLPLSAVHVARANRLHRAGSVTN